MVRFINWILGYVELEVIGPWTERFMNLCAALKKDVWGYRSTARGITVFVRLSEMKQLRAISKKANVKIRVCSKRGLWFTIQPVIQRWGLLAGVLIFSLFLGFMSNRIWVIDINGNKEIENAQIVSLLEEFGITQGISPKQFDWPTIRQSIIEKNQRIAWMSLNPIGSVLNVDISERTLPPKPTQEKQPGNLVAARDGKIVELQVYTGNAMVKKGDAVVKGDMLINGAVEYKNGSTVFRAASGKVIAETKRKHKVFIPYEETILQQTGKQKTRWVLFGYGVKIPLYLGSVSGTYEKESKQMNLTVKNIQLPLGIKKGVFHITQPVTVTISQEQAKQKGRERVQEYIDKELRDIQVKNVAFTYDSTADGVWVKSEIFCVENIIFFEKLLIF